MVDNNKVKLFNIQEHLIVSEKYNLKKALLDFSKETYQMFGDLLVVQWSWYFMMNSKDISLTC